MKNHLLRLLMAVVPCAIFAQEKPYRAPEFQKNSAEVLPGVWFSKTEVSIAEYDQFLADLKSKGSENEALAFAPDDSVWIRDLSFNDPYTKYYNHHPAFKPYPVVGISHEGALAYCEWLTSKMGSMRLKTANGKSRDVQVRFRLPTQREWEIAAGDRAGSDTCETHHYAGKIWYPRDHKGRFRFNHKLRKGDYTGYAGDKALDYEGYMITAPVESFPPDEHLGLHNLAGNVAEMTMEKGVSKGGSWMDLQDACLTCADGTYDRPNAATGFRVVAELVKE